ncbi:hypothetical protein [Aureimonas psammosilenae]|uniref:hypothetical protein n=1 Tax=Aureimonas psammosilenae TaxID=2495496 RepID=UPI001260F05A|nr:hypothetical protein [Aureimonas psammosilenae]
MEFADILQDMGRKSGPADGGPGYRARAAGADFWQVLDGFSRAGDVDGEASRAAYRQNEGRHSTFVPPIASTPVQGSTGPLPSLDPSDIAFELGLDAVTSLEDLKMVRRLFARSNHPDRVPANRRDHANSRMTVANALIDAVASRFAR